ncbi:hypothetical protein EV200_104164 [Pedobacter psychrotolerans]|uniref:Uncharacterized protein n=2 Tax=Pedobacter psychrotolerans TaxID=1843235 RepID=A0A4R2HBU4_9SPHI|nr:hypothetical protein EV200_104164 [Pedobacter psychrotolerans]GGE47924.1 hypothetical protein GCM10011413_12480 [Pedobacter psychrotolerans]
MLGLIFSLSSFAQKPLSVKSLEVGITNNEALKIELLENGFSYNSKDYKKHWEILMSEPDTTDYMYKKYNIVSENLEPKVILSTFEMLNINVKGIKYQIRRHYAEDYLNELLKNIRKAYPLKETFEVEISRSIGNKIDKKKQYGIKYSRLGTKINFSVLDDPEDAWVQIDIMSR